MRGSANRRRDVRRELALLVGPEERVALPPPRPLLVGAAGDVARVLDDGAHDLGVALADGVAQRLLDAVEAQLFEQQLDGLDRLAVDGEVERAAAHVVDAVDVERRVWIVLERLTDDGHVALSRCRQVHVLLVGQLTRTRAQTPSSREIPKYSGIRGPRRRDIVRENVRVSWIVSHVFTQLCHKFPIRYKWLPRIHHKIASSQWGGLDPNLMHNSFGQPDPSSQTAARSTRPFFHNTLKNQTDRQTDRPTNRHNRTENTTGKYRPLTTKRATRPDNDKWLQ